MSRRKKKRREDLARSAEDAKGGKQPVPPPRPAPRIRPSVPTAPRRGR
jgi:hypothetical protein